MHAGRRSPRVHPTDATRDRTDLTAASTFVSGAACDALRRLRSEPGRPAATRAARASDPVGLAAASWRVASER